MLIFCYPYSSYNTTSLYISQISLTSTTPTTTPMSSYRTISSTDLKSVDQLNFTLKSQHTSNQSYFIINDDVNNIPLINHLNIPPSIYEMKQSFQYFTKNIKLNDWLYIEDYFNSNLINLSRLFKNQFNEFNFSNVLILNPVDLTKLSDDQLTNINDLLIELMNHVSILVKQITCTNEELTTRYNSIKSNCKLTILQNFKCFKTFENSRIMFDSIIKIKSLFNDVLTNQFGNDLNCILNDIVELIYDYNTYIDDLKRQLQLQLQPITSTNNTFINEITSKITHIEETFNFNSLFITHDCNLFNDILQEVKFGFNDYINKFNDLFGKDDALLKYEIVSFDDHVKFERSLTLTNSRK